MAAKTWEQDFRYPAIQTSMELIRDGYLDDPFRCPSSFCIPVAKRPAVGLTPGKIMLFALVLGFILLGLGAWLASVAVPNKAPGVAAPGAPDNVPLLFVAGFCSLCGMACFFAPLLLDRYIVAWLIGSRARQLIERAGMTQLMTAEISDADQSRIKLSVDGDDHVLIYPDADHKRILIEGTAARYLIRGEDVEIVAPFEFENYIGVQVLCRVGDARLRLAAARVSIMFELIRQVPVLFFLRGWISNKLLTRFSEVLVHQPDDLT